MDGTEQVRPSSRYYFLAFLFLALGIAATFYFLVVDTRHIHDAMLRMDLPGEMDLELKHRETYTVFVEYPALQTAAPLSREELRRMLVDCEVHMLPTGEKVAAKDKVGTATYTYGTKRGVSVLEFAVPHDGSYAVSCQGPAEVSGQKVQVAIGGGASQALSAAMGRIFLVLTGSIVIGTLIFVRVAMLRLQSRRDIRERGLKPV
ncbi:MAG TPA: hypothetical protein VJX72_06270 [Candidatus Acidoferrum sp.]|jgi:hypothetical protein|nr:hypothetical protein [Candidatus Acidoferrum sp.]